MPKVNREHLFAFQFALPPVDQQARIAANLDALSAEIRRFESIASGKLAALDELKQALLHQAFSGQL
jgi:type I restriction enzyme S subunit